MGSFGGDLTNYGQTNTLHGKNIEALYRAPKTELEVKEELSDLENMSMEDLMNLIPKNWFEEKTDDYWEDNYTHFTGKDGQTNAYVKQGADNEVVEYLDRQQTTEYIWKFATDDNHIHFKGGAKIQARGREWFVLKVISQDGTSTMTNKYNAMDTGPYNERLLRMGLKTLVLI